MKFHLKIDTCMEWPCNVYKYGKHRSSHSLLFQWTRWFIVQYARKGFLRRASSTTCLCARPRAAVLTVGPMGWRRRASPALPVVMRQWRRVCVLTALSGFVTSVSRWAPVTLPLPLCGLQDKALRFLCLTLASSSCHQSTGLFPYYCIQLRPYHSSPASLWPVGWRNPLSVWTMPYLVDLLCD